VLELDVFLAGNTSTGRKIDQTETRPVAAPDIQTVKPQFLWSALPIQKGEKPTKNAPTFKAA